MVDFLARFSGPRPPKSGFNISVSSETMMLIGHVALQWAALGTSLDFQIRLKRLDPSVPPEIRKKELRQGAKYQIDRLRELGKAIYATQRSTAAKEFDAIMDKIAGAKGKRDALVHGTFALSDNTKPNVVVVHYEGRKHHFTTKQLLKLGNDIGELNSGLMDFDQWVHYERDLALLEKLLQQAPV